MVTLLGDLIDSRLAPDRKGLHDTVSAALATVSREVPAHRPAAITAGDEFQGVYEHLGDALRCVLVIRSLLEPEVRVRFGVGRGEVTVLDEAQNTQDGPGWWAARAAIEVVEASEDETGWSALRTAYREDPSSHDERRGNEAVQDAVNAALVCQDLLLHSYDARSWSILRGLMADRTQTQIAESLGITRQAVQQRRSSAGMPMLVSAAAHLARLP